MTNVRLIFFFACNSFIAIVKIGKVNQLNSELTIKKPCNLVKLRIGNAPMEMKYDGRIFPRSSFPWFKTLPFVVAHATAVVALV